MVTAACHGALMRTYLRNLPSCTPRYPDVRLPSCSCLQGFDNCLSRTASLETCPHLSNTQPSERRNKTWNITYIYSLMKGKTVLILTYYSRLLQVLRVQPLLHFVLLILYSQQHIYCRRSDIKHIKCNWYITCQHAYLLISMLINTK